MHVEDDSQLPMIPERSRSLKRADQVWIRGSCSARHSAGSRATAAIALSSTLTGLLKHLGSADHQPTGWQKQAQYEIHERSRSRSEGEQISHCALLHPVKSS